MAVEERPGNCNSKGTMLWIKNVKILVVQLMRDTDLAPGRPQREERGFEKLFSRARASAQNRPNEESTKSVKRRLQIDLLREWAALLKMLLYQSRRWVLPVSIGG